MPIEAGAVFVDTNVFVYAIDPDEDRKREIARRLLGELEGQIVLSTKVLNEFFNVATRAGFVDADQAREIVLRMSELRFAPITPQMVLDAIDARIAYSISLWDALIAEAARSYGCRTLLTEDLQHGQTVRGVRIVNPFREE